MSDPILSPIQTLNQLFDTLRVASSRNEDATNKLIDQQIKLIGEIKLMPVDQIKQALREHADQTSKDKEDIDLHTNEIMGVLRTILGKINKMMTVFALVVSITVGSYVIIRYLADDHTKVESLRQELKKERAAERERFLDLIKDEMEKLHKDEPAPIEQFPPHTHGDETP